MRTHVCTFMRLFVYTCLCVSCLVLAKSFRFFCCLGCCMVIYHLFISFLKCMAFFCLSCFHCPLPCLHVPLPYIQFTAAHMYNIGEKHLFIGCTYRRMHYGMSLDVHLNANVPGRTFPLSRRVLSILIFFPCRHFGGWLKRYCHGNRKGIGFMAGLELYFLRVVLYD